MAFRAPAIAAVQFGVSHLPLHRFSAPLRFESIVGAVSAAMIAGSDRIRIREVVRLNGEAGVQWMRERLNREGERFGTQVELAADNTLSLARAR